MADLRDRVFPNHRMQENDMDIAVLYAVAIVAAAPPHSGWSGQVLDQAVMAPGWAMMLEPCAGKAFRNSRGQLAEGHTSPFRPLKDAVVRR